MLETLRFGDGDQCVCFRMVHTLSDGRTPVLLSFCRTILFVVLPTLVIPRSLETDGVRLSLTVGEAPSILMNLSYFFRFRKM